VSVFKDVTRLLALLTLMLMATTAYAHKASDSFLYLDQETSELRVDVALRDLALVLPLDTNGDQTVTGAELRSARAAITRWTEDGITASNSSGNCELIGQTWGLSSHSDGPYAAAAYAVQCPDGRAAETLDYQLLFKQDPLHRGLLSITRSEGETLGVFSPDQRSQSLNTPPSALAMFGTFVYEGVFHLLIGLDHLLFLLVLMLPATLRQPGKDQSRSLKQRIWQLTGIVTAFTVAHSITLALAIAWIETVIALSIALAALNVAWPILGQKTWKLAFGFGLIHGFGFASVLGDLTSGLEQTVLALAGFNVGVEAGQIALLLLVFPVLYSWGKARHYGQVVVPVMLLGTGALSLYWVAERAMAI
jgi:hypothetical protein